MNYERTIGSCCFGLALLGLLSACGERTEPPIATTICELPTHAQHTVRVDADISVGPDGRTLIGDSRCATTKIELRLSESASRAGAPEQLKAAAQGAASSGNPNLPAKLTGVFTTAVTGDYFIADSISGLPAVK